MDIERSQQRDVLTSITNLHNYSCKNQCHSLVLITGEAGAGKMTLALRTAYTMVRSPNAKNMNLLWYDGKDEYEALKVINLYRVNQKPIIIFVDTPNIMAFVENISGEVAALESFGVPILFVVAARLSEWENALRNNKFIQCKQETISLDKLTDQEIVHLINKLEIYDKLDKLKGLTNEERFGRFKEKCERQLLVAMLEATSGKNFKEIILDEYLKLQSSYPDAAKAYALVALFYCYHVSTPISILIKYLSCDDEETFWKELCNLQSLL